MALIEHILRETIQSPVFLTAVAAILALEHFFPADPEQKVFSTGFFHDLLWLLLALAFTGSVLVVYTELLRTFYDRHLGFLTVKPMTQLPEAVRILLGILLADFLAWFQHWLKHKIPWFWQIHTVHHSQRQMNLFTDLRFHYLEYIISKPIVLLPLLMLSVETPNIVGFGLISTWQTRFYHANIRTHLGPLRYLFVTPQSHRIHHSIEPRHFDKNFGVMFSFWDRIFRTHYAGFQEYPKTGVKNPSFPLEKSSGLAGHLQTAANQMLYPFLFPWRRREE